MSEKSYSRVEEAELIIKQLKEKLGDLLYPVDPTGIIVMGIDDKPRPATTTKLASINKPSELWDTVLSVYKVPVAFVIELYWSDWHKWTASQKQWILLHEIMHIDDEGKLIQHDVQDFRMIVDVVGTKWMAKTSLPNIIAGEIEFDKDTAPVRHKEKKV